MTEVSSCSKLGTAAAAAAPAVLLALRCMTCSVSWGVCCAPATASLPVAASDGSASAVAASTLCGRLSRCFKACFSSSASAATGSCKHMGNARQQDMRKHMHCIQCSDMLVYRLCCWHPASVASKGRMWGLSGASPSLFLLPSCPLCLSCPPISSLLPSSTPSPSHARRRSLHPLCSLSVPPLSARGWQDGAPESIGLSVQAVCMHPTRACSTAAPRAKPSRPSTCQTIVTFNGRPPPAPPPPPVLLSAAAASTVPPAM